jgi:hypothetical protein
MTRNERQRHELLELCAAGSLAHAVDLAFEHFAHFGPDREVIDRLDAAVLSEGASVAVRRRLDALRAIAAGPAQHPRAVR